MNGLLREGRIARFRVLTAGKRRSKTTKYEIHYEDVKHKPGEFRQIAQADETAYDNQKQDELGVNGHLQIFQR